MPDGLRNCIGLFGNEVVDLLEGGAVNMWVNQRVSVDGLVLVEDGEVGETDEILQGEDRVVRFHGLMRVVLAGEHRLVEESLLGVHLLQPFLHQTAEPAASPSSQRVLDSKSLIIVALLHLLVYPLHTLIHDLSSHVEVAIAK